LIGVTEALVRLCGEIPGAMAAEYARVAKRGEVKIVISLVPPDDLKSLPSVDIREHVATPQYTGPTKKGVRFAWDKLPEVIGLLKTQAEKMGAEESRQPSLFADAAPVWVDRATESSAENKANLPTRDSILAHVLPDGPNNFLPSFSAMPWLIQPKLNCRQSRFKSRCRQMANILSVPTSAFVTPSATRPKEITLLTRTCEAIGLSECQT
jgi:hypothetical protein